MRVEDLSSTATLSWTSVPAPDTPTPAPTPAQEVVPYNFMRVHYLGCCGIKELCGISNSTPTQALQDFCFQRTAPEVLAPDYAGYPNRQAQRVQEILERNKFSCAFVLFTQAYSPRQDKELMGTGYGDKLSAYIQAQGLGEVNIVGKALNPNSSNYVTAYLWKVDHKALFTWWEKNPIGAGHRERLLQHWKSWKETHLL